jgi:hypothetical protein
MGDISHHIIDDENKPSSQKTQLAGRSERKGKQESAAQPNNKNDEQGRSV